MMERVAERLSPEEMAGIVSKASKRKVKKAQDADSPDGRVKVLTSLATRCTADDFAKRHEELLAAIRVRYKKGEALMRFLLKSRIHLPSLDQGNNPCRGLSAHVWLEHACDVIIDKPTFTKSDLRDKLVAKMGWASSTANSHALTFTHTLCVMDVLQERDGAFALKR